MVNVNRKGKQGEREVAHILNKIFGSNLRRTPQSGGLSIKGDIIDTKPGTRIHEYHIEVKNQNTISIKQWFRQAMSDCGRKIPVVIFKTFHTYTIEGKPPVTYKQWYVVEKIEDWSNELKMNDDLQEVKR